MGDYTYMRGKVKIKKELIEVLRPRFTRKEDGNFCMEWKDLDLPDEIKLFSEPYSKLCDPESNGDSVPGSYSSALCPFHDEKYETKYPTARMIYSEDGELNFLCASKHDKTKMAFVELLPLIADSWDIQYENSESRYESFGLHIVRFQFPVPKKNKAFTPF